MSPQFITMCLAGLAIIPRLMSPHAFLTGTLSILIFWVAAFVMLPDYVQDFELKSKSFIKFPLITKALLIIIFTLLIITFICNKSIYNQSDFLSNYLRRALYLTHPLICLSWIPIVKKTNRLKYIKLIFILTFMIWLTIVVPSMINESWLAKALNNTTSFCAGNLLSISTIENISIANEYFYNESFSIKVGFECSSLHQIFISLFVLVVFYICCRIKSVKSIILVFLSSIIATFFFNTIRISLLGYFISRQKVSLFEFWHNGFGSLLFSLLIMALSCSFYYFFWKKENPLHSS